MIKPTPPKPPPMKKYKSSLGCNIVVNEYETVDWYTEMGKPYPHHNPQPKNWLERLFMKDYELKLEESLRVNKEMSRQWPSG